jgi:hypothetical protein
MSHGSGSHERPCVAIRVYSGLVCEFQLGLRLARAPDHTPDTARGSSVNESDDLYIQIVASQAAGEWRSAGHEVTIRERQ